MKLSSTAAVLIAAVAAFPGASAATVSLRGVLPDMESFGIANCDTKEICPDYGPNTCDSINRDCDGQCVTCGNSCCYPSGQRNCRNYNNINQCERNNCDWVNNQCRNPTTSFMCSDYDNTSRSRCEDEGCSWNSSRQQCRLVCRDFDNTNKNTCERSGYCSYNNSNRRCNLKNCSDLDNTSRQECEGTGVCTWSNSNSQCDWSNEEEEEEYVAASEEEEISASNSEDLEQEE